MLIPISISVNNDIIAETECEKIEFKSLGLTEDKIEEFLRKQIQLLFDGNDDGETLLIVGHQVMNLRRGRNDLGFVDKG